MTSQTKPVYQPLHPSLRDRLDPEYVKFHDEIGQYLPLIETLPWNPLSRTYPSPFAPYGIRPVEVGDQFDKDFGTYQCRIFKPDQPPADERGWPVLMWFHGGGWVNGSLDNDNGFLRHVCKYLRCLVVSVNYRHAPEDPFPAANEDALAALEWITSKEAVSLLSIDLSRLALGGMSAGGCLTAILSMRSALLPFTCRPIAQILVVPVIDNTATTATMWATSQHAPLLTPARMQWYRHQYLPHEHDRSNWEASPSLAPAEIIAKSPKTFIAVAECDLLAPEALGFAAMLQAEGVETEVCIYKGATHSILSFGGTHSVAKKLVHDICKRLAKDFGVEYDSEKAPLFAVGGSSV